MARSGLFALLSLGVENLDYSRLESNIASMFDERVMGTNNMHFQDLRVDFDQVLMFWEGFR